LGRSSGVEITWDSDAVMELQVAVSEEEGELERASDTGQGT